MEYSLDTCVLKSTLSRNQAHSQAQGQYKGKQDQIELLKYVLKQLAKEITLNQIKINIISRNLIFILTLQFILYKKGQVFISMLRQSFVSHHSDIYSSMINSCRSTLMVDICILTGNTDLPWFKINTVMLAALTLLADSKQSTFMTIVKTLTLI